MLRKKYTAEFKTKVILYILQGDKEFNKICAEHNLNPSMVRKWKQDFLQNAHLAFDATAERKNAQRKEDDLKKKTTRC
ncbi:putative transposase [Selenomonas sp. WCT3]|uniref:transposase n=1 Tax=Selenomonas sp. WCT3 TaxID=3158785 RepID=UPI00088DFB63|nr:putative transposase [Selenomonas ruminantium]